MASPKCTYCGGTQFYGGPTGGMAQNILCANKECRHWFNFSPFGIDDLNRIEPTDEEKKAEQDAAAKAAEEKPARLHAEGASLYFAGKPSIACFTMPGFNNYAAPYDDVLRFCGWVDSFKADITPFVNSHRRLGG